MNPEHEYWHETDPDATYPEPVTERVCPICGNQHSPLALGLMSATFAVVALVVTVLIALLTGWQIGLLAVIAEVGVVLAVIMLDAYQEERKWHGR